MRWLGFLGKGCRGTLPPTRLCIKFYLGKELPTEDERRRVVRFAETATREVCLIFSIVTS